MKRFLVAALIAAMSAVGLAIPATATVHEITGMFCAGEHGNHFPAGLSGRSNADNFAQPLFATGFVESVEPFQGGVLISFDFDHPASKLVPTGQIMQVEPGTYITGFALDAEHGFAHCIQLRSA
jgi:hypothetical protein